MLNLVTLVIPMPDILVAEKVDNAASGNFINNAIVITTKGKVCVSLCLSACVLVFVSVCPSVCQDIQEEMKNKKKKI